MDTIICPECGTDNPAGAVNCRQCSADLRVATEHPDLGDGDEAETAKQGGDSTQRTAGTGKLVVVEVVALGILSLVIGLFGIAVLIGVGEGTNNAIYAFLAVSLPLAFLAGLFAWMVPRAQWTVALVLSAPVAILCLMSASMGAVYLPGAIWTVACSIAGASLGARLRRSRTVDLHEPPS